MSLYCLFWSDWTNSFTCEIPKDIFFLHDSAVEAGALASSVTDGSNR